MVVAPESGLPTDPARYQELAGGGLHILEVTPDRAVGEAALVEGRADVVVIAPVDAEAQFRAGEQSVIEVQVDAVDPVAVNYAGFLAAGMASEVNREIIEQAAEEGQGYAMAAGEPGAADDPTVGRGRPYPGRDRQHRAVHAGRHPLLRAGRPGPHPAAPRGDARRPVTRARAHDRRHRAVPDRAGQHPRDPDRQGPGLRDRRRRGRRPDHRPARRRVRRPAAGRPGPARGDGRAPARRLAGPRPVHRHRSRIPSARPSSCRSSCCSRPCSSAASC